MSFKTTIAIKKLGQNVIDIILKNIEEIVPTLPERINPDETQNTEIQQILDLFGDLFYDNAGVKRLVSFVQFGNVYLAKVVDVTSTKPYVFLAYNVYDVIHRFNASSKKPVQYVKIYESKYDCEYVVTNDVTTFNYNVIFTKKSDKKVETDLFDTNDSAEIVNFTCIPEQIQVNRLYKKITPIIIDDKLSGTLIVDINGTLFKLAYSVDKDNSEKLTFLSLISTIPSNRVNYALKETLSTYDFSYVIDSYKLEKINDLENEPRYISFENPEYLEDVVNGSINNGIENEIYVESGIWKATAVLRRVCEVTIVDSHGVKHSQYVDFNSTNIKSYLEKNEYYRELLEGLINSDEYIECYNGLKKNDSLISETQMIMDHITIIPDIKKKEKPVVDIDEPEEPEVLEPVDPIVDPIDEPDPDPEPTDPEVDDPDPEGGDNNGDNNATDPTEETGSDTNQNQNTENQDEIEDPEDDSEDEENHTTIIDETGDDDTGDGDSQNNNSEG